MPSYISIEDIQDGMIIAEPVTNNYGQTLLSSGSKLMSSHKKLLKTWNIRTIAVKSDDAEEDSEINDEQKDRAIEYLRKKIDWKPRNAIEKDLISMGIIHAARNITK